MEYLKIAINYKKPILVEKPISHNSNALIPFLECKNIKVAFNRRFYKSVKFAKKFYNTNDISLVKVSIPENNKNPSPLFNEVKKRLNFSNEEINRKSKTRLTKILHDFSFFQIDTLDSFSHHIIRSFANELNYSSDFNVTIDNQDIIEEAVSQVFNNNNKDQNNLLIDFAIKKIFV